MSYGEHQILVIGAACLDMKVTPRTPVVEPARSNPGTIRWGWGGVARNIAENLARLGANVQMITAVGNDDWGKQLLTNLNDLGIDTETCIVSEEQPTASFVATFHHDKRLWVAFDDMAVMQEITPGYINRLRGAIRDADMVCIDANLSARALNTLFRITQQYDIPVCADPTAALLTHRIHPYLHQLALITPDIDEAEALLNTTLNDEEAIGQAAQRLVSRGVDLAIITLGADGLYYASAEERGRIPALPVEVVDPSGAGDALTAAVAYGLLEGVQPGQAVRLGMAAAAKTLGCSQTVCPDLDLEVLYDRLVM